MEEYVTPLLTIHLLEESKDIVTASDPNDNNYSDLDWEF